MLQSSSSIETRASWVVAAVALVTMMMAFGAAWITAVALKDIAAEVGGARSIPALASALAWLGSGVGGILMGRIADRVGTRWTVICGGLMIGLGLAISTLGPPWPLWIGHGLFIGLIGLGGINAPLYIYVSRWFDRRRGSALALISSGSYLAGALWPPVFERAIAGFGWRQTMLWYAVAEIVVIVPLAAIYFRSPPEVIHPATASGAGGGHGARARLPPNVVFAMMCGAGGAVLHSDGDAAGPSGRLLQRSRHQPLDGRADAVGAARHRLPQPANLGRDLRPHRRSRHRADRIGLAGRIDDRAFCSRRTKPACSPWRPLSGSAFPASSRPTCWRCANCFRRRKRRGAFRRCCCSAASAWRSGGWLAGLLYDHFGYYAPAFAAGIGANILNMLVVGVLVARQRSRLCLRHFFAHNLFRKSVLTFRDYARGVITFTPTRCRARQRRNEREPACRPRRARRSRPRRSTRKPRRRSQSARRSGDGGNGGASPACGTRTG